MLEPQIQADQSIIFVRPSREAMKRKMNSLQHLGKTLLELPKGKFDKLHLPEALLSALNEARRLTAKGAMRRQLQFIGSIMDQFDEAELSRQLRDIDHAKATEKKRVANGVHTKIQRLLNLSDNELFAAYQDTLSSDEIQNLRQRIRQAKKSIAAGKNFNDAVKDLAASAHI